MRSLTLSSLSCLSNLPNNVSLCTSHVPITGADKQMAKRTYSAAATGKDKASYRFHFRINTHLFLVCWKSGSNTLTLRLHGSADVAVCSDQGNVTELGMNIANLSLDCVRGSEKRKKKLRA